MKNNNDRIAARMSCSLSPYRLSVGAAQFYRGVRRPPMRIVEPDR
jgi:hypothetical protein